MEDDDEDDESNKSGAIMAKYLQQTMEGVMFAMEKANTSSCEPMLVETLSLLSIVSSLAAKDFSHYYN